MFNLNDPSISDETKAVLSKVSELIVQRVLEEKMKQQATHKEPEVQQ